MSRVRLAVTVQPVSLHQRARHLPRPLQRTATQMEASPAPPPQPIPPPPPPRPPQTQTQTRTPAPPAAAAAVPRAALTTSHQRRGKRNRALSSLDQWTESICDSQGN